MVFDQAAPGPPSVGTVRFPLVPVVPFDIRLNFVWSIAIDDHVVFMGFTGGWKNSVFWTRRAGIFKTLILHLVTEMEQVSRFVSFLH